jgi:hypothetical protein
LTFDSDSKLTRIEDRAFRGCKALKSICIPRGIQQLDKNWTVGSALAVVIFESSASLQAMMEHETIDLEADFDIVLIDWDGVMSFPGYSVCTLSSVDNSFRLVKKK